MSRANSHLERVKVFRLDGMFYRSISRLEAHSLIDSGDAVPVTSDLAGEIPGWRKVRKCNFRNIRLNKRVREEKTKASLTLAEMMACVGLSRFRNGVISRSLMEQCRAKWQEFGQFPSWAYRSPAKGYGTFEAARDAVAELFGLSPEFMRAEDARWRERKAKASPGATHE